MVDDDPPAVAPVIGEYRLALLVHLEPLSRRVVVYFSHETSSASHRSSIATILDLER
jgi:hypothetical protein